MAGSEKIIRRMPAFPKSTVPRMLHFFMLPLSVFVSTPQATGQLEIGWLSTPGHVACISNSDVVLNWTYINAGRANVKWTYKGTNANPQSLLLMDYDNQGTAYIVQNTPWSSRLKHTNTTGSAAMVIANVTSSDEGIYECEIYGFNSKQDISDVATLVVISEDALMFNITIANSTFKLSVPANGTNITLPGGIVIRPNERDIGVRISLSSLVPPSITTCIHIQLGNHVYDAHCCVRSSTCHRNEPHNKAHFINQQLDMLTILRADIQNLGPIYIRSKVVLENTEDAGDEKMTLTPGIIVGIAVGLIGILGIGIGTVVGVYKKNCTRYEAVQKNEDGDERTTTGKATHATTSFISRKLIGIISREHNKHIPRDLTVAEYVFCFDSDNLISSDRIPDENQMTCELLACITALLNTCGGIIIIKNVSHDTFDSFKKIIREFICERKFLTHEFVKKYVSFKKIEHTMYIILPKSRRPCIYKYNAYTRDSNGCKEVTDNTGLKRMLGQTEDDIDIKASSITLNIDGIEDIVHFDLKRSKNDELLKEVNSLQNVYTGGYLVLEQQCVNGRSEDEIILEFENSLRLAFNELAGQCTVCTAASKTHGPPKTDEHWTLMPIRTKSDAKELHWAIKVREQHKGAFLKCPECFIISDTGSVMALNFDELKHLVEGQQTQTSQTEGVPAKFDQQKDGTPLDETDVVPVPLQRLVNDNRNIAPSSFRMEIPLNCTPKYESICIIFDDNNANVSDTFEQLCSQKEGWLIAFSSIMRSLCGNKDVTVPSCIIMDLLIATMGNPLKLVTVSSQDPSDESKNYVLSSARILKKRLSQELKGVQLTEQLHVDVFCLSHQGCVDVEDSILKDELHKVCTRRTQPDDAFLSEALTKCLKLTQ